MTLIRRHSENYNFVANTETGVTMRWGKTFDDNPHFAPIPELIDISISNHCSKGCSFCYRNSSLNNQFISLEDYEYILMSLKSERWGNVFQVALGGGEPLEHPYFLEILDITKKYNIVPNFTTNGNNITTELAKNIKSRVGAAAISFSDIEFISDSKAKIFIQNGVKTNIHYILNKMSIKQAKEILLGRYNEIISGFNSIIFLTYKPFGRGGEDMCLELNDDLKDFCKLVDKNNCKINIGFDSCFMPMLMHFTETTIDFIEACECAFFSAYIDERLVVKPCSFTNDNTYNYNLKEHSFSDIWIKYWENYRNSQINSCKRVCKNADNCRGGCPYYNQINLCKTNEQASIIL